ncbi:MAG TPA: Uma2 family endonuclease [Bryobacteraceae bacterium]|jgi:Uma2 family endonuclease
MSAQPHPRLTPEEYLEIERAAVEVRSEFYDGRMYAMSGDEHPYRGVQDSEVRHALVIANLRDLLGDSFGQAGLDIADFAPDIVVVDCQRPNPVLIIEVLSRSTEAYDRGFKAQQYRKIGSLQEYAFVSQAEPRVEVFRRQVGGNWLFSEAMGTESVCRFESVGAEIALAEIYSKVAFESGEPGTLPTAGS